MSIWEDARVREIDEASRRRQAARAASDHPWRGPRWACPICKAQPLAGYDPRSSLADVMALAVKRDGLRFIRVDGEVFVTCGPNCVKKLSAQVTRGLAPAFEVVQATAEPPAPRTWTDNAPPTRTPAIRCGRCRGETGMRQVQTRNGWSPTLVEIQAQLPILGWVRVGEVWYCGGECARLSGRGLDPRTLTPANPWQGDQPALARQRAAISTAQPQTPGAVPVTVMPDASYRTAMARARGTADGAASVLDTPFMRGRTVDDGEAPGRAAPATAPVAAAPVPRVLPPGAPAPLLLPALARDVPATTTAAPKSTKAKGSR